MTTSLTSALLYSQTRQQEDFGEWGEEEIGKDTERNQRNFHLISRSLPLSLHLIP